MHTHPSTSLADADEQIDLTLLDLLVLDSPGLWAFEDLAREYGDAVAVRDGIDRLKARGLVHEIAGCVFASRAAQHRHPMGAR